MSEMTTLPKCLSDDFIGDLHELIEEYIDLGLPPPTHPPKCANYSFFINTSSTRDPQHVALPKIYGNVNYASDAYKVLAPASFVFMLVLIAVCFTIFFLHYKPVSPISNSVHANLISITIFNLLSLAASFTENTYLYQEKNHHDMLPFDACEPLYAVEKLAQIFHAVSVWLTATMTVQKCICVCKPFAASQIVTIKATVFMIGFSIILGTAPYVVRFVDSNFIPYTFTVDDEAGEVLTTCRRQLASFIADPLKYLRIMAWVNVMMSRLVPCFIILVASVIIIVQMRKHKILMRKMSENPIQQSKRAPGQKTRVTMLVFFVAMIVFCAEVSTSTVFILFIIQVYENVDILDTEKTKRAAVGIDIALYLSYVAVLMSYCLTPRSLKNFKNKLTELTSGVTSSERTVNQ